VARRFLPVVLVAVAGLADAQGAHGAALDVLLLAVPFVAVAAIASFGEYLDASTDPVAGMQAFLWCIAVVLVVLSCAVRRHALHGVPPLAISSVVACLGVFAVKAGIVVAPYLRRTGGLRPAKP